MNSFYKILVLGSKRSGKSILIKSIKNHLLHNNIVALISFDEPSNKIDNIKIKKYDLILYVTDKELLYTNNGLDYVLHNLNFLNIILGDQKHKLILIINKWDNTDTKLNINSLGKYKAYRCSSTKIFIENILKNNKGLDSDMQKCKLMAALKETGDLSFDFSDYEQNISEIYGDWDNLINYIIINYIDQKGLFSKL